MGVPIVTKLSASQLSLAQREIQKYDLFLEKPYVNLFKFLASNPEFRVNLRGNNPAAFGSSAYIEKTAQIPEEPPKEYEKQNKFKHKAP